MAEVTRDQLVAGLRAVGLGRESAAVVHTSMRAFGGVVGGAATVVEALAEVCGTITAMAGSWDLVNVPAPPGLVRPHNACLSAADWNEFDHAVASATAWRSDLPVSQWLGAMAEQLRVTPGAVRGPHPLLSYVALGDRAEELIAAESWQRPLGALDVLAETGGEVLLLGTDHTSNTTIHLAEQRLGFARFFRYAKIEEGVWAEFGNISGESHFFDRIEPSLRPFTAEVAIGSARVRRVSMADVIRVATQVITADPQTLLCQDDGCRCTAALGQLIHDHGGG